MRDKIENQKQKRIVKRQEKANTRLNNAVSSGNLKKEARVIKKVEKLQSKYSSAGDAKRFKVKYTDEDGTKVKSVENRRGKLVETAKNKATGVKSRQVSKDGVIKKTVTRTNGGVEKEIERGNKRIEVQKYKDEGVKSRKVSKNGSLKKEVTRTPGTVEKEIWRGDKRIRVGKNKDANNYKSRRVTKKDKDGHFEQREKSSSDGKRYKNSITEKKTKEVRKGKNSFEKSKEIIKRYPNNEDFKFKKRKFKQEFQKPFDGQSVGDASKLKVTPFKKKIMYYDASTGEKTVTSGKTGVKRNQVSNEGLLTNMVKNSTFRNMPNSMVEMGSKPENNVVMNKIMKATDNAMKAYGVEKIKNKK